MEIEYEVSREDFINFHLKHFKETFYFKSRLILDKFMVFLLLFVIYFCLLLKNHLFLELLSLMIELRIKLVSIILLENLHLLIIIISFMVLLITFFFYIKNLYTKKYKNIIIDKYSSDSFKNYFITTKLKINDKGIKLITNSFEFFFEWDSIKNLCFVDNYVYMQSYTNDFIFIPTHYLDVEKRNLLLKLIKDNTALVLSTRFPNNMIYDMTYSIYI